MSHDNYFVLCKHPKGGFALVQGFDLVMELPGNAYPEIHENHESFSTIKDALNAYYGGSDWFKSDPVPKYYSDYGLGIHPECAEEMQRTVNKSYEEKAVNN